MGYKIKGALKKSKWIFIIFLILWVALSIVLTTSITVSIVEAKGESVGVAGSFIEKLLTNIGNVGSNLEKSFKAEYISTFWKIEIRLTGILLIFLVIGIIRSMPKNEYSGIENGSSDWASRRTI